MSKIYKKDMNISGRCVMIILSLRVAAKCIDRAAETHKVVVEKDGQLKEAVTAAGLSGWPAPVILQPYWD